MVKIAFWTIIVLIALVIGLGFVAGRKSVGMSAPVLEDGAMPPCSNNPNCVSTEAAPQHQAFIKPITTDGNLDQVKSHIEALGGEITASSATHLQAEFRSRVFGFVDDVLVKMDTEQQVLRVRSSSRVGKSDLGVNRKRVEALRQLISG